MHRLEHGDALSSELWACLTGLRLSWDMGFRKIILESDSTCVIELLTSNLNTPSGPIYKSLTANIVQTKE